MIQASRKKFRGFCNRIVSNSNFDACSLILILIQAILMASADYRHVDQQGNLISTDSPINYAIQTSDVVFTILFTLEFTFKFGAKEFLYFKDNWNNFDLLVIIISPLRSLHSFPELSMMVESTFKAILKLRSFFFIFIFFLLFFGILGLQLFRGPHLHSRCRLTPFPVNLSWTPGDDFDSYRCLQAPNFDFPEEYPSWQKHTSPWSHPHPHCYWPVDPTDFSLCSFGSQGFHVCPHSTSALPFSRWRWCGSDLDALGNHRFSSSPYKDSLYSAPFLWGYFNFDNLGISMMIVFQTMTLTGWSTILYFTRQGFNSSAPIIYFAVVVVLGPLFMLQLIIALVQDSFQSEMDILVEKISKKFSSKKPTDQSTIGRSTRRSSRSVPMVSPPSVSTVQCKTRIVKVKQKDLLSTPRTEKPNQSPESESALNWKEGPNTGEQRSDNQCQETQASSLESTNQVLLSQVHPNQSPRPESPPSPSTESCKYPSGHISFPHDPPESPALEVTSSHSSIKSVSSLQPSPPLLIPPDSNLEGSYDSPSTPSIHSSSSTSIIKADKDDDIKQINPSVNDPQPLLPKKQDDEIEVEESSFKEEEEEEDTNYSMIVIEWFVYLVNDLLSRVDNFGSLLPGPLGPFARSLNSYAVLIIRSPYYESSVSLLVLINTFVLAMDHYPMEKFFGFSLDLINFFLTIGFVLDWFVKILGLGTRLYLFDLENIFDSIIVVTSFGELVLSPLPALLTPQNDQYQNSGSISSLRSLRLLRILRLFKSKGFRHILYKCINSIRSIGLFGVLLGLYLFVLTLFGMQLFANFFRFDEDGIPIREIGSEAWKHAADWPRHNFDDFTHSFATVFQILTGDNWNNILYNALRVGGGASALFPIVNVATGNFIITSLITAMIVNNFTDESQSTDSSNSTKSDQLDQLQPQSQSQEPFLARILSFFCSPSVKIFPMQDPPLPPRSPHLRRNMSVKEITASAASNQMKFQNYLADLLKSTYFEGCIFGLIILSTFSLALDNPLRDPASFTSHCLQSINLFVAIMFTLEMILHWMAKGILRYFFTENYHIEGWNMLDFFVVLISLVGINGIRTGFGAFRALRSLRPLRLISRLRGLASIINVLIAAIPDLLDVVFIFCVIYFIFSVFFVGYFKGKLRGCSISSVPYFSYLDDNTVITPDSNDILHLITYPLSWERMSSTQREWFGPIDPIDPHGLSAAGFNCSGLWPSLPCCPKLIESQSLSLAPTSRVLCECLGGSWLPIANKLFDNVAQGFLSLVLLGTLDNWSSLMWAMVDSSRGIDMQPIRDYSLFWVYVMIAFVILGNFLCMNFFVAVVCEKYENLSAMFLGDDLSASEEQKEWSKMKVFLLALTPKRKHFPPSQNPIRVVLFHLVEHPHFEFCMLFLITFQGLAMSINYFGEPSEQTNVIANIVEVIGLIFFSEMILKIIGLGYKTYFYENWNRFDFFIAIISFLISSADFLPRRIAARAGMVRSIRLIKLLKLAQFYPKIQEQLNILILASPSIINILSLLALILFIFSVMGQTLFAKISFYQSYNSDANFRTFWTSMLTLIRFITGEGWSDFCYDAAHHTQDCVEDPPFNSSYCGFNDHLGCLPLNGCGSDAIFPFLILFTWIVTMVLLNVFVAVMITNLQHLQGKGKVRITFQDFQQFVETWSEFDLQGRRRIPVEDLSNFLSMLIEPFGYGKKRFTMRQLNRRVKRLPIYASNSPESVGDVLFNDVMMVLTASVYERKLKIFGLEEKGNVIEIDRPRVHTSLSTQESLLSSLFGLDQPVPLILPDFETEPSSPNIISSGNKIEIDNKKIPSDPNPNSINSQPAQPKITTQTSPNPKQQKEILLKQPRDRKRDIKEDQTVRIVTFNDYYHITLIQRSWRRRAIRIASTSPAS